MVQYRVAGKLDWQSNSGSAIAVIYNPVGSGKKLTVNSFEAQNLTSLKPATFGSPVTSPATMVSLARTTAVDGTPLAPSAMDTINSWPSQVVVSENATVSSPAIVKRLAVTKQMVPSTTAWFAMQQNIGLQYYAFQPRNKQTSAPNTNVVVAPGEAVSLLPTTLTNSIPLKVYAMFEINNKTFVVNTNVSAISESQSLLTVRNPVGSGVSVEIVSVSIEEMGTYDSPYFQLVPTGQLDATATSDPTREVLPMPMDSAYPSAPFKVYQNIPFLPFGVPAQYLSDASAGSPKGFNYLMTKDFLGPVYRTQFPEYEGTNIHAAPSATAVMDNLGISSSHRFSDMGITGSGIILREGEGIALVSGAETAVVTTAVGVSGWSSWNFAANVSVESKYAPVLTLTGLKPNTEVRIYDGFGNELAGVENSGTSFTYSYSYSSDINATIVVHALGYLPIRFENFLLGTDSQTVPIQQQVDRQYSNA